MHKASSKGTQSINITKTSTTNSLDINLLKNEFNSEKVKYNKTA